MGDLTLRGVCCWLLSVLLAASGAAQPDKPTAAVPVEPIAAIIDAFRSHNVVALGDAHGNEQAQAFLRSLVRDPRFATAVNDIVVEFGNARYQHVADRYARGDDVPEDSLRMIWQNTTIPNEIPVDEEFFRAVRSVNVRRVR